MGGVRVKALYTEEMTEKRKMRTKRNARFAAGTLLGGLAACVILCTRVHTGSAARLQWITVAVSAVSGWAALLMCHLSVIPERAAYRHEEGILKGEPAEMAGVLYREPGTLTLPKSITIRKLRLETENGPVTLRVQAGKARLLPPDGTRVKVITVRKYVTAFEVEHE